MTDGDGIHAVTGSEPPGDLAGAVPPERRTAIYAMARELMREYLWGTAVDARAAMAYLTDTRAITRGVATAFGIGLVPCGDESTRLCDALRARGVTDQEIFQTSLGCADRTTPDHAVDHPRGGGYLAFPIEAADGCVIGFKYRAVPGLVAPTSLRYHATEGAHGGTMFGFARLPTTARVVLCVEGEIDAASWAVAREADPLIPPAVSWHGKELSDSRLQLLCGRVDRVILALDNDAGGHDGMVRGGRKLLTAGIATDVLILPPGTDPNNLLVAGDGHGLARAYRALPVISLLEQHARLLRAWGKRAVDIAAVDPVFATEELCETLRLTPPDLRDPDAIRRAAEILDIPGDTLDAEWRQSERRGQPQAQRNRQAPRVGPAPPSTALVSTPAGPAVMVTGTQAC